MDTPAIQKEKFLSILQNEFDIYYEYDEIRNKTFEELSFTRGEIDFFLNEMERIFKVEISEGEINTTLKFAEFLERICCRKARAFE